MNTVHVTSPDPEFSGESCGIVFTDGAAIVSDAEKTGRQAIEYFRRRGYGVTSKAVEEVEEASGTSPEALFDPAAHDAAEVIDYLDQLDANLPEEEAEIARVIDAERAGKARKTVLALDERG
ncbi:hypothetical protein [Streptomyces sp. NPDC056169]|uniref:hypothetical protein n=1 Tax=Streptomyces sp. NPDC056169 TaxID=3345734 RepID=UPI0035E19DF7